MRLSLSAACCAALLYLSRTDCMTVSPILYLTTAATSPQYAAADRYYDSGGHASSFYDGGGGGRRAKSFYGSAPAFGYGHRSMPDSSARAGKPRPVRDDDQQSDSYVGQPYETAGTYEYMTNPSRKTSEASRVPGTERRPPGQDVELIGDGPRTGKGPRRKRKKKIRKHATGRPANGDDDDYRRAADPDVGSSSKKDVRKDDRSARPQQQQQQKKKKNGGRHRDKEEIDERYVGAGADTPVKHKIHKKNEFSKRQQFFDEEHVDHGKKKMKKPAGNGRKGHEKRAQKDAREKRAQKDAREKRAQQDAREKRAQKDRREKRAQKDGSEKPPSSQGYGHVLVVKR